MKSESLMTIEHHIHIELYTPNWFYVRKNAIQLCMFKPLLSLAFCFMECILSGYIKLAGGFRGSRAFQFLTWGENFKNLSVNSLVLWRESRWGNLGQEFPKHWIRELTSLLLSFLIYQTRMLNLIIQVFFQVENSILLLVRRSKTHTSVAFQGLRKGSQSEWTVVFSPIRERWLNWIQLKPCLKQHGF